MYIPFDTHPEVRKLEIKGFTLEQPEAITDTVRTGIMGGVTTKADLVEVRSDIARLETAIGPLTKTG